MGKRLTTDQMERVLSARLLEGKSATETAKRLGVSVGIVSAITRTFEAVKDDDIGGLARRLETDSSATRPIVEFCFAKLGLQVPQPVEEALAIRAQHIRERLCPKPTAPEPKKPIIQPEITEEQANETVFFTRILQEMMRLNENLEQLMDVVIPKYCGDMKDCINANMDSLHNEVKTCEQRLEKIQYNSRKSGM